VIISFAVHIQKNDVDAFAMRTHDTAHWKLTQSGICLAMCCHVFITFCGCFVVFAGQGKDRWPL